MSERPSFGYIFITMAELLSRRSTCARLKVGCVITSEDNRQVFAVGYNGNASGMHNDCDKHGPEAVGACGCLHAEENAVINCVAPRSEPKVVYCTHLPCVMRAKRLINLGGVKVVYYKTAYRLTDSQELLQRAGITVLQWPEAACQQ